MYVDSKPMSGYGDTQGWRLPTPSPQPSGSLKRPPLLSNNSSSSSLSGMEQAIPSFQSFIKRTPPPETLKPLPPTPLIPRRASSTSPPRSRGQSVYSQRRSSSVYSRTVSQWFDDDSSWRNVDLRDDPMPEMPPLPILQPVAYSKSTPQLIERPPAPLPPMLEPRTYSPPITSPSPTASRVTTPQRSPMPSPGLSPARSPMGQRKQKLQSPQPSAMFPMSPPVPGHANKQVQTVSLEQAKAAVHSPGAVHLLPEELRARTHGRSRSFEPVRVPTMAFFEQATTPPELPNPPTLVDAQGRHRSLVGQLKTVDAASGYPFPIMHAPPVISPIAAKFEGEFETPQALLETQVRQASKAKAAESLGLDDDDEPRGRTRQRGPRSTDYSHYMPKGKRVPSSPSSDEERNDAQKVASKYHNLLSESYRQSSSSPAYNSDDSIRTHMKMVPQPLFKNKPAAKMPGSMSGRDSERGSNASESPFHLRADSVASKASATSQGSLPVQLSLTPESMHRRSSTSGSIPISPPSIVTSAPSEPMRKPAGSPEKRKKSKTRRPSKDERVSMYYPYVGSRKGKKAKEKRAAEESGHPVPAVPLLPANVIAQRLQTPDGSTGSSPLRSTPPTSINATTGTRKDSNASSDRQRAGLFQRLAGNAVKYADLIHRPSGIAEPHTHQSKPPDSTSATRHSPHLLPSPVNSNPPPIHLGWTDTSKASFDRSRSSLQSARSPQTPTSTSHQFTHFSSPPRTLDEARTGLHDSGAQRGRKGSIGIFGGLLDGWKERRKEEKREELKKIIRVVPQGPPPTMRTRDIEPHVRAPAPGLVRQASMGAATGRAGGARPVSGGGLGRSMSGYGWM